MPCVNVPVLVADEQVRAEMKPTGKTTVLVKVQFCPPILKAKLAVPLIAGVPVIVKVNVPAPLSKVPAAIVAVKPVTPVDNIVWAVYVPLLPPEYETLLLTLVAAIP